MRSDRNARTRRCQRNRYEDYFTKARTKDPGDDDVILCGDFNRNVGDAGSLTELLTIPGMIDTTAPKVPTTIDTTNTYDHVLFQTDLLKEYTGVHGVIKFDEDLFGNDDKKANLACSDHRPVWVTLKVHDQDDD